MKLQKILLKNFKSIEEVPITINQVSDGSYSFGLIGINEAGKSSLLKGMALKDLLKNSIGEVLPSQKDFNKLDKPVEVEFHYILDKEIISHIIELLEVDNINVEPNLLENVVLKIYFNTPSNREYLIDFINLDVENKSLIEEKSSQIVFDKSHHCLFWTSEDRFLISNPIPIGEFANDPDVVSIPLRNCFYLAGIDNIADTLLNKIPHDSTEKEALEDKLGSAVTAHIKRIWPNHPITITFSISDAYISFHIKDNNSNEKAKTTEQRSDGFKQFISFLLTISAQSKKGSLSNVILLLDEPETHLHPKAQEFLLQELIDITKNDRNNIVFFATHSNYMIDKIDLSRNLKVEKIDTITNIIHLDKKTSSYAGVNYEVFDIITTDYHNELYGRLLELSGNIDFTQFDQFLLQKNNQYKLIKYNKALPDGTFVSQKVTISTKVRHLIHHPENQHDKYSEADLRKSIELMRSVLDSLEK